MMCCRRCVVSIARGEKDQEIAIQTEPPEHSTATHGLGSVRTRVNGIRNQDYHVPSCLTREPARTTQRAGVGVDQVRG